MSAFPHTIESPAAVGPVPGQERIEAIDILRGAAILGILIVNMGIFSMPAELAAQQQWPNAIDRTAETLILFFAQEKFKTLFSFIFGLGLAVQMARAEARGTRFIPLYLRRLAVLFLIGVAHCFLTIIICLIQIPLSVWWLRRFPFGPIEWLWRSLTYWQRQPMRVSRRQ